MNKQVICSICGQKIDINNLENHIRRYHNMSYSTYYEISKTSPHSVECWKCNSLRIPLTPYSNNYYLPCLNCITDKNREKTYDTILEILESYIYDSLNNKYIQYYLSVDNFPSVIFPHTIENYLTVVNDLKFNKHKLDNTTYLEILRKNNFSPFEVSNRNIDNIELNLYNQVLDQDYIILSGYKYKVIPPEICDYDSRHHTKYSVLNTDSSKGVRKLKLSDKTCLKFQGMKIFRLSEYNNPDNIIDPESLSLEDRIILKNYILRNKILSDYVVKIYLEICKFCEILNDEVFIKNTIPLGINKNSRIFHFTWFPDTNFSWDGINPSINLSIL